MPILERKIRLGRPRDEVFAFFSDAFNLETITPPWLAFRILTAAPIEMRKGTLIDYRLRLRSVPIRWQSEITAWEPPVRFVDEQRRGPYRRWIHEHSFVEADAGATVVRDRVDYKVPGGAFVDRVVAKDLDRIFAFRHQALLDVLG